jgi:hypothetical protein
LFQAPAVQLGSHSSMQQPCHLCRGLAVLPRAGSSSSSSRGCHALRKADGAQSGTPQPQRPVKSCCHLPCAPRTTRSQNGRETQTGQSCSPNVPQLQLEGSHDFVSYGGADRAVVRREKARSRPHTASFPLIGVFSDTKLYYYLLQLEWW